MWKAVFDGFEARGHPVQFAHVNRAILAAQSDSKDAKDSSPAPIRQSAAGLSFDLFDVDMPSAKMNLLPSVDAAEVSEPGAKSMSLDFSLPQVSVIRFSDSACHTAPRPG